MDYNNIDSQELNQDKAEKFNKSRAVTHSFDTDLAKEFGIEIALMHKHVVYWVNYNKDRKSNFHEGRYWFYNTLDDIAAHFPYWSKDQVNRLLRKMVKLKLILKGNFNKIPMDRTGWYTINAKAEMHIPKSGNGSCQMHMAKSPNGYGEIASAIPNTKTNTNKTLSKDNVKKDATALLRTSNKFIERVENVKTTDEEHLELEKKYGQEVRNGCYEHLRKWKIQTPKRKWKNNDFLSIKKWVVLAYHEEKEKENKLKKFLGSEDNISLARRIAENFNPVIAKQKGIRINVTSRGIQFICLTSNKMLEVIAFTANGFKEQVNNKMIKLNLI